MITKIEPKSPYDMGYAEVKEELIMRLHDAGLIYKADQRYQISDAFFRAEKLVKDADFAEARKGLSEELFELSTVNAESSTRIHALFNYFQNQKENPVNGKLIKVEQFELIETEVVDEFGMSQSDVDRLVQLEFAIDKGRALIGDSLREIRDSQLYKQYGTFEDYCHEKWGFSRSRAYQLMGEAIVVHNLLTSGVEPDALPQNEGQTRALAAVPVEKQAEVWTQAKAEGKPTAAKIKAIAKASALGDDAEIVPSPPGERGQKEDEWNPNLWETPDNIARIIVNLLLQHETSICEPTAGTGSVAKIAIELGVGLYAFEILPDRAKELEDNRYFSVCDDFLTFDFGDQLPFDVVVTNPPFDIGMEVLERSLSLIKSHGRCLFLLPLAYFSTQERAKKFAALNAHIHRVYPIVGRVAYLKNGIPESGRQCEDAIFDIRLGKDEACMEFIWQ